MEDEFLLQILATFRRTLMLKAADSHVFFGVVKEIKMTSDWLRCILTILLKITKVFNEYSTSVGSLTAQKAYDLAMEYDFNSAQQYHHQQHGNMMNALMIFSLMLLQNRNLERLSRACL